MMIITTTAIITTTIIITGNIVSAILIMNGSGVFS